MCQRHEQEQFIHSTNQRTKHHTRLREGKKKTKDATTTRAPIQVRAPLHQQNTRACPTNTKGIKNLGGAIYEFLVVVSAFLLLFVVFFPQSSAHIGSQ